MLNIAVIGCGYWGENHIRTLKTLGALYAISDIDEEKAKTLSQKYDVKSANFNELLQDSALKGMVFALPPQYHAQYAIKAMSCGKDVFVEKPMALDLELARDMVQAAEKYQAILMVGHLLRFHPAFAKITQLVKEQKLGRLRYIYAHRLGFGRFNEDNDALWDLAPHDLSMLLALSQDIAQLPARISAIKRDIFGHGVDLAHLHIDFTAQLKGHIFISRFSPYSERRVVIIGEQKMLIFDDLKDWPEKIMLAPYDFKEQGLSLAYDRGEAAYIALKPAMPLSCELEHFLAAIKSRQTPLTDGYEGLKITKLLKEIAP